FINSLNINFVHELNLSRRLNMPDNLHKIDLQLNGPNEALDLFGINDKYLKHIEGQLNVSITTRGEQVRVSGNKSDIKLVEDLLLAVLTVIRTGQTITERDIVHAINLVKKGKIKQFETLFEDEITRNVKGKTIRFKTLGQKKYTTAIKSNELVFGIGPAGTGKTYLAVVMAVHALK